MKTYRLLVILAMLAACGPEQGEPAEQGTETVGAEIARDYNKAMDKARDVENLGFEQKDRLDAALEAAESRSGNDP